MTVRHAFQKRDYYTCSVCGSCVMKDGRPYCNYVKDFNNWNIFQYGCGNFSCNDSYDGEKCTLKVNLLCYGASVKEGRH